MPRQKSSNNQIWYVIGIVVVLALASGGFKSFTASIADQLTVTDQFLSKGWYWNTVFSPFEGTKMFSTNCDGQQGRNDESSNTFDRVNLVISSSSNAKGCASPSGSVQLILAFDIMKIDKITINGVGSASVTAYSRGSSSGSAGFTIGIGDSLPSASTQSISVSAPNGATVPLGSYSIRKVSDVQWIIEASSGSVLVDTTGKTELYVVMTAGTSAHGDIVESIGATVQYTIHSVIVEKDGKVFSDLTKLDEYLLQSKCPQYTTPICDVGYKLTGGGIDSNGCTIPQTCVPEVFTFYDIKDSCNSRTFTGQFTYKGFYDRYFSSYDICISEKEERDSRSLTNFVLYGIVFAVAAFLFYRFVIKTKGKKHKKR